MRIDREERFLNIAEFYFRKFISRKEVCRFFALIFVYVVTRLLVGVCETR